MKLILFLIFVISQCSQVCFPGERISTVRCSRINERGEIEQVADIQCDNKQKPAVLTEPCNEERTSDNCKGEDKQINIPAMHVILKTYHTCYSQDNLRSYTISFRISTYAKRGSYFLINQKPRYILFLKYLVKTVVTILWISLILEPLFRLKLSVF